MIFKQQTIINNHTFNNLIIAPNNILEIIENSKHKKALI